MEEQEKYYWWLVSYAWFRDGKQGFGNYTHGTTLNMFDNSAHEYAKESIEKMIKSKDFCLLSVSSLGYMSQDQAVSGEIQ